MLKVDKNYDLVHEFMEVLEQHEWTLKKESVKHVLDTWKENKSYLINIFRKHPNWNEERKMIVFSVDYERGIDFEATLEFYNWVWRTMHSLKTFDNSSYAIIDSIRDICKRNISKEEAERLNNYDSNIRAREGQKTTRVINKLLTSLGINKHNDYNRKYASYSDALSPIKIKRHTCISLNPIDFLLMSNGNSWTSCHRINGGEYCSGTISYLLDKVSFVFYTVDAKYDGDRIEKEPKINRQIFCYGEDKLLQSRLYPSKLDYGGEELYTSIRNIVQEIISTCLDIPNLWVKASSRIEQLVKDAPFSTHYADYFYNSNCTLTIHKESTNNNILLVGYKPICVNCGEGHVLSSRIACCFNKIPCNHCGIKHEKSSMFSMNGKFYCINCAHRCRGCGEVHKKDDLTECSNELYCSTCIKRFFVCCGECGETLRRSDHKYVKKGDKYICYYCLLRGYTYCDECDTYVRKENVRYVESTSFDVCDKCLKKYYKKQGEDFVIDVAVWEVPEDDYAEKGLFISQIT